MLSQFLIPMMTGQPVNEKGLRRFQAGMETALDRLESVWLRDTPYLAGQQISVADLLAACELEQPSELGRGGLRTAGALGLCEDLDWVLSSRYDSALLRLRSAALMSLLSWC